MNTNPENNPEALFQKGKAYYDANNYPDAIKCFRQAARRKHAGAQCCLGLCFLNGEGVPQDDEEAVKHFRKAAEQGHARAQFNLGLCYWLGRGVEERYSRFSANEFKGRTPPRFLIKLIAERDIAIPRGKSDIERLNKLLIAPALYSTFLRRLSPKRKEDIRRYVSRLSCKGLIKLNRGILQSAFPHLCPEKEKVDYVEAYKWMTVSAPMNDKHARKRLDELESQMTKDQIAEGHFCIGELYAKGKCVPKDLVEAHARVSLAVSRDLEGAKEYRDTLEKTLTTEQIKDARRRLVWYQNPRRMRLTDKTELKQIEDARWRGHGELRLMRFTEKGTPEPPADARHKPGNGEELRLLRWADD